MTFGTFTVLIDGAQYGGMPESAATVRVSANLGTLAFPDIDQFRFPRPEMNVALPYELVLDTDVPEGASENSEIIGYNVTVTTPNGGSVTANFAARPANSTIALTDVAEAIIIPVNDTIEARDIAVASAASAQAAATTAAASATSAAASADVATAIVIADADGAMAAAANSDASAFRAALTRNGAKPVGRGELVLNVVDYGAVGDGVTNDAPAINAAITAANAAAAGTPAVVYFPWTASGYGAAAIVLKANVTLRGENRVTLTRVGAATSVWLNATGIANPTIENLTIKDNGLSSVATVRCSAGTSFMTVRNCKFLNTAQPVGVHAFSTQGTSTDLTIEDCTFENLPNNIRVGEGVDRVTIRRNTFTGWKERCIYIVGNATLASKGVTIERNTCINMAVGGTVRQPISVQGTDTAFHERVAVNFNTVVGPGTSYQNVTTPGTADQISLHRCKGFEVIGNISVDGGEVGITVALQCQRGVVANNVITNADNAGLALGSGTTTYVRDIVVTGNTLVSNGMSRDGSTPTSARCGMYLYSATDLLIGNNRVGDDQVTKTQLYAYYLKSSTRVVFGTNADQGNATAVYNLDTGNTGCTKPATAVAL